MIRRRVHGAARRRSPWRAGPSPPPRQRQSSRRSRPSDRSASCSSAACGSTTTPGSSRRTGSRVWRDPARWTLRSAPPGRGRTLCRGGARAHGAAAAQAGRRDGRPGAPGSRSGGGARGRMDLHRASAAGRAASPLLRRRDGGGEESLVLDVAERAAGAPSCRSPMSPRARTARCSPGPKTGPGPRSAPCSSSAWPTARSSRARATRYGDFAFSADGRWLVWTFRDASSRPSRVYRRSGRRAARTSWSTRRRPGVPAPPRAQRVRPLHLPARLQRRHQRGPADRRARRDRARARLVEPRREGVIYRLEDWSDRLRGAHQRGRRARLQADAGAGSRAGSGELARLDPRAARAAR